MKLIELAEKVEAATGPDRALDWEVHCRDGLQGVGAYGPHPAYTASIDVALSLTPDGWRPYAADMSVKDRARWMLGGPKTRWTTDEEGDPCAGNDWYAQGIAATPALALCAAALRARAAMEGE